MRDSLPLGPVETDSLIWSQVALHKFEKDSAIASQRADSFFLEVNSKQIHPFQKMERIPPPQLVPSLFKNHQLQATSFGTTKTAASSEGWLSVIMLGILMVVTLLNWRYFSRIKTLFNAFLLNRFIGQLIREENIFINRVNILLSGLYLMVVGTFSYCCINYFKIKLPVEVDSFPLFLLLCTGLFVLFLVKILVVRISGSIFALSKSSLEYSFSILLYNQMASVFLIPILLLVMYVELINPYPLFLSGIGLLVFFYLFRLFRVITGGLASPSVSLYYLFLYLCTLEFLPVAITIKIITG